MPRFVTSSMEIVRTCHPDLQRVFLKVVNGFDCKPLYGHRSLVTQQKLFASGRTEPGPILTNCDGIHKKSKHQSSPSLALDIVPYPVNWADTNRFYYFAGYVRAIAESLHIEVEWGGDWDMDTLVDDQTFFDLPHWQLKGES